ncbi:MAG: HAD-IC family P-type ATPase, partial [Coriobacteriales bacterium]|nr:HAD-IC family P-type ATPase [Coriobacteriales bacterium]
MKIRIEHQIPGRLRIRVPGRILDGDARALEACLCEHPNILSCTVYGRSGSVAVEYRSGNGFSKRQVLELLRSLGKDELARYRLDPTIDLPLHAPRLFESTAWMCLSFVATRFLLPYPLRVIFSLVRLAAFLIRGWRSLLRLRLDVAVLDAAALASCAAARDFATLSSSAFLIRLSELVEEHTQHSVEQELIFSLLRIHDKVALLATADVEDERLVDARDLREGDLIVVRTGQALPVDGVVLSGEAWVNQQALTGEARAVLRECGDTVFAGTALEDGELIVRVLAVPENTRLRSIIGLVQQSESQKSISQLRMERLANRIVPFNLLFALVVYAFSRDLSKLVAALTVDYSCALRLTGSVAALAAMREASALGLRVKGSRAFEAVASADTIIFDKTGTLTEASPSVSEVIALNDWSVTEILRLAACLEEHFPHPVARAIVAEA